MGFSRATYFAYGIRIADTPSDVLDAALNALPEDTRPGYLLAGNYDQDMTFLVTEHREIKLGTFELVTPESFNRYERPAWDVALRIAAEHIGVEALSEPGWFTVPDMS